jgi:CspA family cold shock protein
LSQSVSEKRDRCYGRGHVKWFSNRKGYGFIEQEGGQDIFVHFASINMPGFRKLSRGNHVSFDMEEGASLKTSISFRQPSCRCQ